jgi:disulfide bond formation protein DsbB
MPSRDRDLAPSEAMTPPASHAASHGAAHAASHPARKTARHAAAPPVLVRGAGLIAYLAVLICVAAGIYIAWHQGGHGAGLGGVIAGTALLVAAFARLTLPTKLAGLLAVRHRGTDAVTLLALGACLLTVGLVLPGL